ncbi:hypothetical protein Tco_0365452 [Tanacetum coccineum]
MSKLAEHAQTPANSVVRNTAGKGIKQATKGPRGFLPEDRFREICEKHYNQILPIMAEKVHQEKLQGVQTRLAYSESSRQKAQTKEKTQLSESETCDRKRRTKKRRSPSPDTMSRSTRPGRSPSVFSRLRQEESSSTRQRIHVSTTVFTRLGVRDRNVFTRMGEKKRDIHSWLGPKVASRHKHTSDRRRANSGRSVEDPNHRRKEIRNLARSYVTCSNERQREIKEEWDAANRANRRQPTRIEESYLSKNEHDRGGHWKSKSKKQRSVEEEDLSQPWLCEEIDPFTARIHNFEVPKKPACQPTSRRMMGQGILKITLRSSKQRQKNKQWAMPTWCHIYEVLRKAFLKNFSEQKKYIKDPVEIHHIKQKEGELTKAFMERFKAESMHVEEAVKSEQLSHLIKELKQGSNKGENAKAAKKGLRKIQAVPSMTHGMIKFPVKEGIVTLHNNTIIPTECRMVVGAPKELLPNDPAATEGIKVAIHPEYPK